MVKPAPKTYPPAPWPIDMGSYVVTYIAGAPGGEFPHCAPWYRLARDRCTAALVVDGDDVRCSRDAGHVGPHVEHLDVGVPLIAWLIK